MARTLATWMETIKESDSDSVKLHWDRGSVFFPKRQILYNPDRDIKYSVKGDEPRLSQWRL